MNTDNVPVATLMRTYSEDGLERYSMTETPPMVWADPFRDEAMAVLRRNGYRFLRKGGPHRFDDLYTRSWFLWATQRPLVLADAIAWRTLLFLYKRPIVGVKKGMHQGYSVRFRDLRPFPFGHRMRP